MTQAPNRRRPRLQLIAAALVVSAGLAGCASSGSGATATKAPVATLKSEVPSQFASGITVATQADIAPLTYTDDNGDVVGFDQDLVKALSTKLGVPITIQPVTFENLILGLESGKYDFVADTTIKKARLEKYDMLSYLTSSYSVATLATAKKIGTDLTAMCGLKLGVVTGEIISDYITGTVDPQCTTAGKSAVQLTEYKDFASATLAVQSENVEGMVVDTMTFGYFQSSSAGKAFEFNGPSRIQESDSGFSFMKTQNGKLAAVVKTALTDLVDDGSYAKLLKKYGLTNAGITGKPELNPATNL